MFRYDAHVENIKTQTIRLNAEEIAGAWNSIGIALRNNNSLPGDMRELLVRGCFE